MNAQQRVRLVDRLFRFSVDTFFQFVSLLTEQHALTDAQTDTQIDRHTQLDRQPARQTDTNAYLRTHEAHSVSMLCRVKIAIHARGVITWA